MWKCVFDRGNEHIQSHFSLKISPLIIFFIICIDPANEYLYSGELRKNLKKKYLLIHEKVRKKSKLEIFFIHESVKIWHWGEHLLLGCYLKPEIGYTQILFGKSHLNYVYYTAKCFSWT